jgi:D-3-phosphoglycerate dehydrogenase
MMNIALSISKLDPAYQKMADVLSKEANVTLVPLHGYSLHGIDVLIGKELSSKDLETADQLKAVFAYKTGVDDFPLALLAKKGIILVNSHSESRSIAEYSFVLAATLCSHILPRDRQLRDRGQWISENYFDWESFFSKKVGLLGYGHIGKAIHTILLQNGIKDYTLARGGDYTGISTVQTLVDLAKVSDVIISSLPDTPLTRGVLNRDVFAHMKGKYLVDVGRSSDIVLADLYEALKSRTLAGAAIDGWDDTPDNRNKLHYPYDEKAYPFQSLDNIILSPHCATQIDGGHERYVEDTTANVLTYLHGDKLDHIVDLTKGY